MLEQMTRVLGWSCSGDRARVTRVLDEQIATTKGAVGAALLDPHADSRARPPRRPTHRAHALYERPRATRSRPLSPSLWPLWCTERVFARGRTGVRVWANECSVRDHAERTGVRCG